MKKLQLKKINKFNLVKKVELKKQKESNNDNYYDLKNQRIISSLCNKDTGQNLVLTLANGRKILIYYFNTYDDHGKKEEYFNGVKLK